MKYLCGFIAGLVLAGSMSFAVQRPSEEERRDMRIKRAVVATVKLGIAKGLWTKAEFRQAWRSVSMDDIDKL